MKRTKEFTYYIAGLAIMTLGIALIIQSNIGASPWDSVSVGLAENVGNTTGFWTFITGIGLVIGIDIYTKQSIKIMPIVIGLVTGVFINFWLGLISPSNGINIIDAALGIIAMGLGIALYTSTNLPVNPIDHFMTELYKHEKFNIGIAKAITDGIGLIIGLLVGGPIGIGTIIIYFSLPVLITFFKKVV